MKILPLTKKDITLLKVILQSRIEYIADLLPYCKFSKKGAIERIRYIKEQKELKALKAKIEKEIM